MIKRIILIFLVFIQIQILAQDPSEIMKKNYHELNARNIPAQLKSVRLTYQIKFKERPASWSQTVIEGVGYKSEIVIDGKVVESDFALLPNKTKSVTLLPFDLASIKRKSKIYPQTYGVSETNLNESITIRPLGNEEVDGVFCNSVMIVDPNYQDLGNIRYSFHPETNMLVKEVQTIIKDNQSTENETVYSSYETYEEKWKFPNKLRNRYGDCELTKVEINPKITSKDLTQPKL